MGKEPANAGDVSWIPGLGRSPGGGNGNPLQYSCRENITDRGGYRTGVTKSLTQLSRAPRQTIKIAINVPPASEKSYKENLSRIRERKGMEWWLVAGGGRPF